MTEVAPAAGYLSIRRFNDAIRRTFRMTPTELRDMRQAKETRRRRSAASRPSAGALSLRLPYRPPLDWEALLAFLARRATPGIESVDSGVYRRTIEWNDTPGAIEVQPAGDGRSLDLRVHLPVTRDLLSLVDRVNRIFDLGADPDRIAEFLRGDPALGAVIGRKPGLRVPGAWDPFELSVRAILGQQVSVRGATTLAGRLVAEFGRPLPASFGAGLTHLYPRPADLAEADLARIGLPGARAETIRALSRAVAGGTLRFGEMKELDEIVSALTAVPGIGDWTAHYIAMRAFGEPDAFPASDLGLRHALGRKGKPASAREVMRRSEAWKPWRSYAAIALWMSEERKL
jgi:AraC family transcriptional regulator of adaptative response / DNA-3-methyladenine glycosylase II